MKLIPYSFTLIRASQWCVCPKLKGKKVKVNFSPPKKVFPPYFQHFPSVLATSFFYGKESKGEGDSFVLTSSNSPTATVQTSD